LTSSNAIIWMTQGGEATNWLHCVTYGDGLFVVVGGGGTVLTSPDGVIWTPQSSRTGADLGAELFAVTHANGLFVAVGGYSRARYDSESFIMTSPDGITWTSREPRGYGYLFGVAHGNDSFVAVGGAGNPGGIYETILSSPDGINWTVRSSQSDRNFSGVSFGHGTFVAVGAPGAILTSADAVNWIDRRSGPICDFRASCMAAVCSSLSAGQRTTPTGL
jgi:hypothetical protein